MMNNILIDLSGLNGLFDEEFKEKEQLYKFLVFVLLGDKPKDSDNMLLDNNITYLNVRHSVNDLDNSVVIDYVYNASYDIKEFGIIKMLELLTKYKQNDINDPSEENEMKDNEEELSSVPLFNTLRGIPEEEVKKPKKKGRPKKHKE